MTAAPDRLALRWAPPTPCVKCGRVVFSGVDDNDKQVEHVDAKGQPVLCLPVRATR